MSDPRLHDPLIPPTADQRYVPQVDRLPEERTNNGSMWGMIAVVAALVLGGFLYYKSGPQLASTPPASTTGAASQSDQRPAPPVPPAPPVQQPK